MLDRSCMFSVVDFVVCMSVVRIIHVTIVVLYLDVNVVVFDSITEVLIHLVLVFLILIYCAVLSVLASFYFNRQGNVCELFYYKSICFTQ